jgi:molecular chaperone HscB
MLHAKEKYSLAETLSSRINAAYQVLLSPLSRVEYILNTQGFRIEETDHMSDVEFISEIMEVREELEVINDPQRVDIIEKEYNGAH